MSFSAIHARGIVTACNGADRSAHESVTYDGIITEPEGVAGTLVGFKPIRRFDPGMKIHPAAVNDPFDALIFNGETRVRLVEGVAFSPCAAGPMSNRGGFMQMIRKLFASAPAPTQAANPDSGSSA